MKKKLSEMEISALKEATNIGAGHAAIAMSQMLNKKIMMAVTWSDIIPSDDFLKRAMGGEEDVAGIYLKMLGDIKGVVIFMFKRQSVLRLSDMLLFRKPGETKFIDEKSVSAIKELSSILTGTFFAVLADMLDLHVFNQAPNYAYDSAKTILSAVSEDVFGDRNGRMCLATEFIESGSQVSGAFAFIPEASAMDSILEKWRVRGMKV